MAAVRRGTIAEIVTLPGRVIAANELAIAAPENTQTRRIFVGPGRAVSEGQPLIETEGSEAQRRAEELRGREQAAARRAEAAQMRIKERQEQVAEELSRLPQPGALTAELQLAQSAVSQARVGLQRAEADLAALTAPPSAVDLRVADQQIRTSEIALQRAEANRERVLDGPTDAELSQAETDVATAEVEMRRAVDALQKLAGGPDAAKLQAAKRAVQLAQSELQLAQQTPPDITRAQEIVRAARNRSSRERRAAEATARQQIQLALQRQKLDVERAEAELADAVRTLQDVSRGPASDETEAASRSLDTALRRLASARERLAALQAGPAQLEIDEANVAVETARATLEQSQARHAALVAGPPAGQLAAQRSAVASARIALTAADEQVTEVTNQQRQVARAQEQLSLFAGIRSGANHAPDEAAKPDADPDIVEFAQAQTELAEARSALASVTHGPVSTTLVAPSAGIVTAVLTGPGEDAGPDRPAVTMVRTGDLIVQASLETTDGSRVAPGMSARVRLRSAPDSELAATVSRVDLAPNNRVAQITVAWSSPLPAPGTDAQALVSLERRENVLLVPIRAIRIDGDRRFVDVVSGDTTQPIEVQTGLTDGVDVEIVGGVQEGQRVLLGNT